jgi:hypothetical protein
MKKRFVTPVKDKKRVRDAFEKYQGKAVYRALPTEPEPSEWGPIILRTVELPESKRTVQSSN